MLLTQITQNISNAFDGEQKTDDHAVKDCVVAVPGNFIRRVEVLMENYYKSVVPAADISAAFSGILPEARALLKNEGDSIEKFRFREALGYVPSSAWFLRRGARFPPRRRLDWTWR